MKINPNQIDELDELENDDFEGGRSRRDRIRDNQPEWKRRRDHGSFNRDTGKFNKPRRGKNY